MNVFKASIAAAIMMSSLFASGQRTCLEGCQDGNRVSVTFNPRAAQSMFDSLFFRLDSLTAYIEAMGGGGSGTGGSTSGGGSSEAGGGSSEAAFTCGTTPVTFDGHDYSTVEIGSQCWFAENLRTTQYADGSVISEVTDNNAWKNTNDGAFAAYNNEASNLSTYGYLYNWYAVNSAAGLCPSGWHVPTDEEWTTLTDGLGGLDVAGAAMKSSAWDGTNTSGFSALPGGLRNGSGYGLFYNEGIVGYWWSASPDGPYAWSRILSSGATDRSNNVHKDGFSVRCLRDE